MPRLAASFTLSTGAKGLDGLLGGGVPVPCTLELVGPAGSGKTQLCHQLAVMVQLPPSRGGLAASALYVDTEGTFRPERIVAMAEYRGLDPSEALDRIVYARARSWEDVVSAVAAEKEAGLVLVDSLSSPFRGAVTRAEAAALSGKLSSLAAFLLRLALKRKVGVVFTSHAVGAGSFGDPYLSLFVCARVYLEPAEGVIVARVPGRGQVRLVITEEGVLSAEG